MEKRCGISRRRFLIGAAATVGGATLLGARRDGETRSVSGQESGLTPVTYLPCMAHSYIGPPFRGKVVHVHSDSATDWAGESDYWNHVDQGVVNEMVDQGLMELTQAPSVADAWRALIPAYHPGEKIAIKVNFNNTRDCRSTAPRIDALMHPINALASGLAQIGVAAEDICVYDAVRALPDRFLADDLHGVSFFDSAGSRSAPTCTFRYEAGFSYEPESRITFYPPPDVMMPEEHVTDVLMDATYLINMPIMKGGHGYAGVTLGFKNHFGTIDSCAELHTGIDVLNPPPYWTDYNPLVDLMRSPLIGGKTVLTIGDGLFAAKDFQEPPEPWITFGNQVPNSLFFAKDPVAIDCVMHDFLAAELGTDVPERANNYLRLAAEAGLGIFEQGAPQQVPYGTGYQSLQYVRLEL